MAISLMTKLDAVNTMLERVWESPVSSLDTTGVSSVAAARRVLDNTIRTVLTRGWSFNTDEGLTLTRDGNSKIPVPANALEVDASGDDADRNVVVRSGFLYDKKDNTFVFDADVECTVKYLFDFEELPQAARSYIALLAARVFKDAWEHAESQTPMTFEEREALRNLEEQEASVGDHNIMDSWDVSNILQRW